MQTRGEKGCRMRKFSWPIRASILITLISVGACGEVTGQQTAAQLVALGNPQACAASETQNALHTALGVQPSDIVAITFSAADPATQKVRCRLEMKTGSVEFEVAENLAASGRITVRQIGTAQPIAANETAPQSISPKAEPRLQLASPRGHTFDIPDHYPKGYDRWRAATAQIPVSDRPWVRSLQGTGSDVRQVNIAAEQYLLGWVCEPHNCGGNEAVVLISRDQTRSFGYVRLTDKQGKATNLVAGRATAIEAACAKFFLEDRSDASTCDG
jgi:hypothetical protein